MRLIDADALTDSLDSLCDKVCQYSKAQRSVMCGACPLGGAFDVVEDAPTVDAVEREHGRWIKNDGRYGWHCSVCNVDNCYAYVFNSETEKHDLQDRYCPNCGAEMRGGTNDVPKTD